MKLLLLLFTIYFSFNISFSQSLIAGDIAIIGVNEDAGPIGAEDHSFTWIALTDIPAGEIIYFTEQGININSMSWFGNSEGHYSWTSPAGGLSCGAIVHIYENGAASESLIALGGGTMSGVLSGGGWNLSSGDQVIAYQSSTGVKPTVASATFITAIHLNDDLADGETNGWTSTAYNGTGVAQCHLPPGLINGSTCISLFDGGNSEFDNVRYNGTLSGDSNVIRATIMTTLAMGNWSGNNTGPADISVGTYTSSVTCIPLSTEDNFTKEVRLYPNPTEESINLSLDKIYNSIRVKVRNVLGQTVFENEYDSVDRISLGIKGNSGIYFVEVLNDLGQVSTIRLIKE